jgi:2-polyprenyl-3-methyl-5-hydroxy-6-metoxy-1,4-benzoquinol methylase
MSRFFPEKSRRKTLVKRMLFDPHIPDHIKRNYININDTDLSIMKTSLEKNFFSKEVDNYLHTIEGKNDLNDHLISRLDNDRRLKIPWLDDAKKLKGANVLEIGCGTGVSSVALSEQGANVTAIDVDRLALIDAKNRCDMYGVNVNFHHMNAIEASTVFSGEHFDFIIFWACLEHMTHDERMLAMKETWNMLPDNALWCVTETPNRLHYFDSHTSLLPYYMWLPDDLAMKYSRFSPRNYYNSNFVKSMHEEEELLSFYRWGRGLSFHEFEIAMLPIEKLNIISSLNRFYRKKIVPFIKWRLSFEYKYESLLHSITPKVNRAFFQPYLDLIIKKAPMPNVD